MLIRAGYTITLECYAPTPVQVLLNVHPDRVHDLQTPDQIRVSPDLPHRTIHDGFGNSLLRVLAPAGRTTFSNDFVIADSGLPDVAAPEARQLSVDELPNDVLQFLLPSRYCDADNLSDLAWSQFANSHGWARVQSICDYTHQTIRFSYPDARPTRSASDSVRERVGVCRDFAHLAITLCRAMNIPARYCTGYLGDIGITLVDSPMDFSAWFEAFLEGRWWTFDARHNVPRIGRVVMARGRDAADCAITHSFGSSFLREFTVVTDEIVDASNAESMPVTADARTVSAVAATR